MTFLVDSLGPPAWLGSAPGQPFQPTSYSQPSFSQYVLLGSSNPPFPAPPPSFFSPEFSPSFLSGCFFRLFKPPCIKPLSCLFKIVLFEVISAFNAVLYYFILPSLSYQPSLTLKQPCTPFPIAAKPCYRLGLVGFSW